MRKRNEDILKLVMLLWIFLVSIFAGRLIWQNIVFTYHNPWQVTGPLTSFRFNPLNNIARFAVFITLPLLLLAFFYFVNVKGFNSILFGKNADFNDSYQIRNPEFKPAVRFLLPVALISFTILFALNLPTFHILEKFDPFHEGETLGPSISYMAGKIPYKDYIFCHGLFQDPLRSVTAFALFGKSIGSVRTFESIIKILSIIILALIIIKLYHRNYLFSFITIIILVAMHTNFLRVTPDFHVSVYKLIHHIPDKVIRLIPRDINAILFLIPILFYDDAINKRKIKASTFSIISFLFAFIAFASMAYSVDQGFYLIAAYVIIIPVLYFSFFRKTQFANHFIVWNGLGIISACILLLVLLKGNFTEFFKYTFVVLPKYKELLDGDIYPIFKFKFFLVLLVIAANTYWIGYKFLQELHSNNNVFSASIKSFFEKYFVEFTFLILSIFFFRTALGRADQEHIAYSSWFIYLLSLYIFLKHYFYKFSASKPLTYSAVVVAFLLGAMFLYRIEKRNLITFNFPIKINDTAFIPKDYKPAVDFLRNNLNEREDFYTMTSEASWFYFLNKPCPTRFPVVYFASPLIYQQEVVEDLKKSNVKFIIYRNKFWSNTIDHFSIESRHPLITNYIKQNFVFYRWIGANEVWVNKEYAGQYQSFHSNYNSELSSKSLGELKVIK